jgi:outer membrane protein assembly factor BamB
MVGRMWGTAGRRAAALVAMLVVSLPGCWLQIGGGPGHIRYQAFDGGLTTANVDTLHELWSVEVPGALSEPMVSDGRVFVTRTETYSSAVRAVDADTGETLWNTGLVSMPPVSGAFAVGTPVTFVGDRLASGFFGFVPIAPGRPVPGPACTFGSTTLDPATGSSSPGAPAYSSASASAAPVVARALLTVTPQQPCNPAATTITLEVTGARGGGWTEPVTPSGTAGSFVPTLAGDRVLLTHGASVDSFAIDGCTESCLRWTRTLSPEPQEPVVDRSGPIFVRTGEVLLALDRADGATLWRAPLAGTLGRNVAVANGTVYVASVDASAGRGVIQAFDAAGCGATTCEPQWEGSFDGTAVGEPIVGGGVVYVPDGNSIVAFDAAGCGRPTCDSLADVAVPGTGRLALSDGRLYLAGNGRLTALAPE